MPSRDWPRLVFHHTPADILAAYFDISAEEAAEGAMGGVTPDGAEVEFPAVDVVRKMGLWGFHDETENTIHAWIAPEADLSLVIRFLGHELGHAQEGASCTQEEYDEDDRKRLEEESRADRYGEVVAKAYEMLLMVLEKR